MVVGVIWLDGPGGMVLLPGLWLLLTAPLNPASPYSGPHAAPGGRG